MSSWFVQAVTVWIPPAWQRTGNVHVARPTPWLRSVSRCWRTSWKISCHLRQYTFAVAGGIHEMLLSSPLNSFLHFLCRIAVYVHWEGVPYRKPTTTSKSSTSMTTQFSNLHFRQRISDSDFQNRYLSAVMSGLGFLVLSLPRRNFLMSMSVYNSISIIFIFFLLSIVEKCAYPTNEYFSVFSVL